MIRLILGAISAAVAMFLVGFLFYATPLSGLGTSNVGNTEASQLQSALAANLRSTGTYAVPDPGKSAEQTAMFGTGPVATVHYNSSGFAGGGSDFVSAIILNFLVALTIGLGLKGIARQVPEFIDRAKLVALIAGAGAFFIHIGRPIYLHHDWMNAIYSLLADGLALAIGGIVIAWFIPENRSGQVRATSEMDAA